MTVYEDEFEETFSVIDDSSLRGHMGDALRFASLLAVLATKYDEPIKSACYKAGIISIGSIAEAAIHHCVIKLGFLHYEDGDWNIHSRKLLHSFEATGDTPSMELVALKRSKKTRKLDGYIHFGVLNKFCRDEVNLYDDELYKEIDKVRVLRNKIHLRQLSDIDRKATKEQLDFVAKIVGDILGIISHKLGV